MAKNKTATIKEVAKLANVSHMTVSRVLNNRTDVKSTTRKRVMEAIRELNYRPNIMARNLAGRSGVFIGLIYNNPSHAYLSNFLLGALDMCREGGHYLIVEEPFIDDEMVNLDGLEKRFLDTSIQALIVVPPLSDNPKLIETLERVEIPFVCVSPREVNYNGDGVRIDDRAAASEITDYLFKLGHERVAHIAGPNDHLSSELRRRGFEDACKLQNKPIDGELVAQGDYTYVSGMHAMRKLLSLKNPPTAIFACNDDMAVGALAAIHQAGLQVPQDISVVGFDDTENASAVWPPLTTVRQPIREMAGTAIKMLAKKVSNSDPDDAAGTVTQTLDYEIVVRESTAPPKDKDGGSSQKMAFDASVAD